MKDMRVSKMKYCHPQDIVWPQDRYGVTSKMKDAVIAVASRVGGYADKKAILDATMKVALEYLEAKYARENKDLMTKLGKSTSVEK